MLPYHESEYKPKQINFDFESARENLMNEDVKTNEKRCFDRIHNAIESMAYTKIEIFFTTKGYLFMDSKIIKQIKSLIIH